MVTQFQFVNSNRVVFSKGPSDASGKHRDWSIELLITLRIQRAHIVLADSRAQCRYDLYT